MKKLQNDFTTPEQSKRLLELGVPTDSANGGVYPNGSVHYLNGETFTQFATRVYESVAVCPYLPCWSVGRLIEIYERCTGKKFVRTDDIDTILEDVLYQIKFNIININCEFDFSKLEE